MKWLLILLGIAAYMGIAVLVGMFCGVGSCDDGLLEDVSGRARLRQRAASGAGAVETPGEQATG